MKILITGSKGFIGNHLTNYLHSRGVETCSLQSDVTRYGDVLGELESLVFDKIVHLAGISHVVDCEKAPDQAFAVNVSGTVSLLEALIKLNKKTQFIFASTAQVYNSSLLDQQQNCLTESFPVSPKNVYARTKLSAESLIQQYFSSHDIGSAVCLRLFNHVHYSQGGDFIFPYVLSQIAATEKDDIQIPVGNIDLYRDFSLVQDLLQTFYNLLNSNMNSQFEVFNVCSSQARKLRDLLNLIAKYKNKNVTFITDKTRLRANDPLSLVGSNYKMSSHLNVTSIAPSDEDFVKKFFEEIRYESC